MNIILVLILSLSAHAFEAKYDFSEYGDAEKANSFLSFHLDTKKLGLFKSSVTGFVKKFEANGDWKNGQLKNATVSFAAKDVSTDLYARDDKMWNYCFDFKKFEKISLSIKEAQLKDGETVKVMAQMQIRGKMKEVPLEMTMKMNNGKEVVTGSGELSIKGLEIPDPSIGVASVEDLIHVNFRIEAQ